MAIFKTHPGDHDEYDNEYCKLLLPAFGQQKWEELRGVLADNFTFRGSMASFDTPEDYIAAMKSFPFEGAPIESKFMVDGNRVAHAFVWQMTAPVRTEIPMCEVLEIENGKVQSAELFYDSAAMPT